MTVASSGGLHCNIDPLWQSWDASRHYTIATGSTRLIARCVECPFVQAEEEVDRKKR